ncbi:MAG: PTS sugar transporter subunit IIA [Sphaerochaetaceae bacterium]|nr:PTS sugar transporter subunit IIA [Sphaerochaetaceae bacterium]MDC7238586.1 PTS sugar transporter subunit IIA [Sphaerochaetaceae bacterium]MDC7242855.1 PTS sugar transporter subunit IIA [Sphaerochaetaceae bacterium]MDC7249407.1 PTS sugar transporter subunit IIA [Sphaerochaetaceae bacterium]
MKLKNVLNENVVKIDLESNTKDDIIKELLAILKDNNLVDDVDLAYKDVMSRETKMSTGIQHGVAIPHAKTKAVNQLTACIGLKKEGVDFNALDGEKSNIFIMTLSPSDHIGPHVQFLAEVSRIIKTEEARNSILASESPAELLSVFGI